MASVPDEEGKNEDIDIQCTETELAKVHVEKKELMQALRITSDDEWREWITGDLVKPAWVELWNDLLRHQSGAERSISIGEIQKAVAQGDIEGSRRYSPIIISNADKGAWTEVDYWARFVVRVKRENLTTIYRVFCVEHYPEYRMYQHILSIGSYLLHLHAPCIIGSPRGGTALMGTTRADNEDLPMLAPITSKRMRDGNTPEPRKKVRAGMNQQKRANTRIEPAVSTISAQSDSESPITPRSSVILKRRSDTFNVNEAFWRYLYITRAVERFEQKNEEELDPTNIESLEKLITLAEDHWSPPIEGESGAEEQSDESGHFKCAEVFSSQDFLTSNLRDFEKSSISGIDTIKTQSTIIQPTKKTLDRFEAQQKLFDNIDYQRDNLEEACDLLGIANKGCLRQPGMLISQELKFWQPPAIARLLEIEDDYHLKGAILADAVGLGKTWTTTGFLLHKRTQFFKACAEARQKGRLEPRGEPILIVVPPSLITHWHHEISNMTNFFRIWVYHGDTRSSPYRCLEQLDRHHPIFNGSAENAKHLIITSYQTLDDRHGPAAVKTWARKNGRRFEGKAAHPPTGFPFNITGLFKIAIFGEAHSLINTTHSIHKAAVWLQSDFNLLVTATPLFNSIREFQGYMPFLLGNQLYEDDQDDNDNSEKHYLLHNDDPTIIKQLHPSAIFQNILRKDVDPELAGARMQKVLKQLMIRRTLLSRINFETGPRIGDDIPAAQRHILTVRWTETEAKCYSKFSQVYKTNLFTISPGSPSCFVWNMYKYRRLSLLSAWLGMALIRASLKVKHISRCLRALETGTLCQKWIKTITNVHPIHKDSLTAFLEVFNTNDKVTPKNLLFLLAGSPKLRKLLPMIRDQVIVHHEKATVWCSFHAVQVLVATALAEAGISAGILYADQDTAERENLLDNFNLFADRCMVLICTYGINLTGVNLQAMCRNVHLFDAAMSQSVVDQAIGRVCRLGQSRTTLIYEYKLDKSCLTDIQSRSQIQAAPGLVTEIAREMYMRAISADSEEQMVDESQPLLKRNLVIRDNQLIEVQEGDPLLPGDDLDSTKIMDAMVEAIEEHMS